MHDLSRCVSDNPLIADVRDLMPEGTYLVGGCIRDMLMGRDPLDLDLVTYAPVDALARAVAERLHASAFWMDEKRGVMRIASKASGRNIDICRPKGDRIEEDLLSRDLTINAMAFDLTKGGLIDPTSGVHDLSRGLVRIISEDNILDDPLRCLRAIRFSVVLDFALHDETVRLIRKNARRLQGVSPERIRQEVVRALDSDHGTKLFRLLAWAGLAPVLFPPSLTGGPAQNDLWDSVFLKAVPVTTELDGLLFAADALMPGSRSLLDAETESGVKRSSLLKLAAFFLGLGSEGSSAEQGDSLGDRAGNFCKGLRFSSRSIRMMRGLLGTRDSADRIISKRQAPPLEMYRFCEEATDHLPESLLLSLAWAQAHDLVRRQEASSVWEYYSHVYVEYKKSPLVTGHDVMDAFGHASGAFVGRCLRKVEEARASGTVQTRDEALKFLEGIAR